MNMTDWRTQIGFVLIEKSDTADLDISCTISEAKFLYIM